MSRRAGFERTLVSAAIFLSLFPSWHPEAFFFTAGDFLFCLTLLIILLTRGLPLTPFGMLTPYWVAGFVLLMIALLGSSLVNGEPVRALIVCAQYTFSFILLPLTIMGRDKEATVSLIVVFTAGTFVVNLMSIVLYYSGYTGDFRFVTGNGRLASFTGDPNVHAQMIALALPFIIYLWLAGRMATYYLVPLLLTLLLALVLTSSNGGIALTFLGVAGFFVALRSLRHLARATAAVAACLVLILVWGSYWLPATFEERVLGALRGGSIENAGTFQDRLALIEEALEIVDDTMVVGLGVDQYRVKSEFSAPVHNTYLLLWSEGGLPALIGWLTLLMIVSLGGLAMSRRHRLEAAASSAVAVIFGAMGFAAAHIYARQSVLPLHLGLALVMAVAAEARARSAPPPRPLEDVHRRIPHEVAGIGSPPGAAPRSAPSDLRW
jgi:O-antigen ligase